MALDRLWAGWRSEYIATADTGSDGCVFCGLLESAEPDDRTYILWRGERTFAVLNAYPYTSGHLMVMPNRHVGGLGDLDDAEANELFGAARHAVAALERAYRPEGVNLGANLGHAAGAGVPGHLHLHALPRWAGDTNFMTSIAEARVLPEPLTTTWQKLRDAW
jgi:diadenosine tetraphosphate (Ap4A) HIT family hydrolase